MNPPDTHARTHTLLISAGVGPVEVRLFVAALADALAGELAVRGYPVLTRTTSGPDDAPRSVALSFASVDTPAVADLVGTHETVARSPLRGGRSRKRWFAGVTLHADPAPTGAETGAALNPADLEITTCRSGGAGGQHVNTSDSAVIVLHRPSGLRVRSEAERSQHRNRAAALVRLSHLLARRAEDARADAVADRRGVHTRVERGAAVCTWVTSRDGRVAVSSSARPAATRYE